MFENLDIIFLKSISYMVGLVLGIGEILMRKRVFVFVFRELIVGEIDKEVVFDWGG